MAIAVVQVTPGPERTAGGTTVTATFSSSTTAGNAIFVLVWGRGTDGDFGNAFPTLTCYDSIFSTYSQDQPTKTNSGKGCAIYTALTTSGGPTTVTISGGPAAAMSVVAVEVSGLTAYDTGNEDSGTSGSPAPGAFTTTSADEILLAVFATGATANPATVTVPSSWTSLASETDGSTYGVGGAAYRIVSSIQSSYNPAWTATSDVWAAIACTYAGTGGGGGGYDGAGLPHPLNHPPVRRRVSVIPY